MTKQYSKLTHGFYETEVHEHIPEDAVPITESMYNELMHGQSIGKCISVDEVTGLPYLADDHPKREFSYEQAKSYVINRVQGRGNSVARAHGFVDLTTACSFANSLKPELAAIGTAMIEWRDALMMAQREFLFADEGESIHETAVDDFLAGLPELKLAKEVTNG